MKIHNMKNTRILILEDDLKTLSVIMNSLFELEEKLVGNTDFPVTVFSEYTEVENYLNKIEHPNFDIILLDRDCKLCGSFHALDFDKFDKNKIISISSTPQWNEEAVAAGINRVVQKDQRKRSHFRGSTRTSQEFFKPNNNCRKRTNRMCYKGYCLRILDTRVIYPRLQECYS